MIEVYDRINRRYGMVVGGNGDPYLVAFSGTERRVPVYADDESYRIYRDSGAVPFYGITVELPRTTFDPWVSGDIERHRIAVVRSIPEIVRVLADCHALTTMAGVPFPKIRISRIGAGGSRMPYRISPNRKRMK